MTNVVRVSREQVEAARLLVALSGRPQMVDPVIAKIAAPAPAPSG